MMKKLLLALFLLLPSAAWAANCNSLPFSFVNGQVADANQINSDFALLLNCANNNLAHNGPNSDITSLSALSTPLPVNEGGTGLNTIAPNAIPIGNGAATPTLLLPPTITGADIVWTGSAWSVSQSKPAALITCAGNTLANGVITKLTCNNAIFDTTSNFNTSTNRYTPPAGIYQFNVAVYFGGGAMSQGSELLCWVGKNGTSATNGQVSTGTVAFANGSNLGCNGSFLIQANGTDTFELDAELSNSTGGTTTSGPATFFSAVKVSN